jgi:hypothetical protein
MGAGGADPTPLDSGTEASGAVAAAGLAGSAGDGRPGAVR